MYWYVSRKKERKKERKKAEPVKKWPELNSIYKFVIKTKRGRKALCCCLFRVPFLDVKARIIKM
jgi:hypothetical protein